MSWGFELARPWMLLWIGLLIPVAIYYWRSLSDFPKSQRIVSLLIRSLILALAFRSQWVDFCLALGPRACRCFNGWERKC